MAEETTSEQTTSEETSPEEIHVEIKYQTIAEFLEESPPNLYAITYLAVDECGGKLDINETRTPEHSWRKKNKSLLPMRAKKPVLTPYEGQGTDKKAVRTPYVGQGKGFLH